MMGQTLLSIHFFPHYSGIQKWPNFYHIHICDINHLFILKYIPPEFFLIFLQNLWNSEPSMVSIKYFDIFYFTYFLSFMANNWSKSLSYDKKLVSRQSLLRRRTSIPILSRVYTYLYSQRIGENENIRGEYWQKTINMVHICVNSPRED